MTMPASVHEHPEEWLAAALAGGLAPEERRALDEHLAGCAQCRALQADFAAVDEMLLRDFQVAVGPAGGFEARLVASFRRRHGWGGRVERLRALAGWLVRQRGAQFAGVAAALLLLVVLGQMLTRPGGRTRLLAIQNDAWIVDGVIDQSTMKSSKDKLKRPDGSDFQEAPVNEPATNHSSNEDSGAKTLEAPAGPAAGEAWRRAEAGQHASFEKLASGKPTGFVNADANFDRQGQDFRDSTLTLRGANITSTGVTSFTGSYSDVGGTVNGGAIAGGYQASSANKGFDGFIAYGSPIQTVSQNALGITPAPSGTPAPASSTQSPAAPAAEPVAAATPAPPDIRKLIRNARAELEVASFDATVDAVTASATRDGGFLDTRNSARGGNGKVSGTLVVKVLPESLDRFLAGLRTLGDVKNQTIQTEDVTKDYFDTDARLRNSRRMEDRLLKMLDEVKGKMSEVLQVEKELARVRADIETMQGQLKLYDAQVRYATVTLSVREKNLDQPAAFVLRETATLSLLATDVEKTAAETRRIADAAHAQTLRSELSRDPSGQWRATLRLLVDTDAAAEVIAQVKALGRVQDYHIQDERSAQNGASSAEAGADAAKVERAPVIFDITISHDEQISRQISLTLVAAEAEGAFEKARAAALAAGGEIVNANVAHTQNGHSSATLTVRVPSAAEAGILVAWQALGRPGKVETQRVASGADTGGGPVLIQLSVVDMEPAVQDTTVQVQTNEVERRAADIKREAAAAHVDVEGSSFTSEGDGRQRAGLKFRLTMGTYPGFIERVRALGTVKEFSVRREDRPEKAADTGSDAGDPVTVELSLYSEAPVVSANSGLGATLRRTFGQGTGALAWSVQMIGVALAFLMPWAALLAVIVASVRWWRRRAARGGKG